ncbi:MAG: tyrosine phosphatase family protein [Stappiaceae bacterium]
MLHVCSLSTLHQTSERIGATRLITLINEGTPVERPAGILPENHLFLAFNDIIEPMDGMTPPATIHVEKLLEFVEDWDQSSPMLIHCWAGISRSTAGAYITSCYLNPHRSELEIARKLRHAAPSATPNIRLVRIADKLLSRDGRMEEAVTSIGRGADAFEGAPFSFWFDNN